MSPETCRTPCPSCGSRSKAVKVSGRQSRQLASYALVKLFLVWGLSGWRAVRSRHDDLAMAGSAALRQRVRARAQSQTIW